MAKGKFVAYYRVSTDKQGRSGLGLDAQREAVMNYLNGGSWDLVGEFTEVESGRRKDRPQLIKALEAARKAKATLIIAKLDRLARNVHFISGLLEAKVDFVAADMPEADRTFLQMVSVFAEWEARKISERTKAALAAAKARGRKLGWSMPSRRKEQPVAAEKGAAANASRADQFAENVLPVIRSIRAAGASTLAEVAEALNNRGIRTARGGQWYPMTVRNIETRADA